jgi:acetate---CoA ligase (ADP-forming)
MESMSSLLAPDAIAVVGASQRLGRGSKVISNLRNAGFKGEIFAVNPRYDEVLGCKCYATVTDLPATVDCLVLATAADTACDVLEQAFAHGIRAAIVLSAGFGEGGHGPGQARAQRLRSLADKGMSICGPNCMGIINVKAATAAFSSQFPEPLRAGPVALVSQSGGLGAATFSPLMADRDLGFGYFVSCGNQIGTTIEDYVEHFLDDPDITVVAIVVESLKNPQKLQRLGHLASTQQKSIVLFQAGRSAAGRIMIQSHTGALASDSAILAAYLRRCGIVQVETFDEFVETIELFAMAPRSQDISDGVVIISGSGGGAASAADVLDRAGMPLADLHASTRQRIEAVLPEFGSVTNPIDGTGAIYDDLTLLPKIFDAIIADPGRPTIAAAVSARPIGSKNMRHLAGTIADAACKSDRTFVAYSNSPLGGPFDPEVIGPLHAAGIPYLLGITNCMNALKYLPMRRDLWRNATARDAQQTERGTGGAPRQATKNWNFLGARDALLASGVSIVDVRAVHSETEAVDALKHLGGPVAIKAEAPGLLHKSDLGCVRLGCHTDRDVIEAYRHVVENARKAGFEGAYALIQPMVSGIAEAYAGIINDPVYGPAICFGLGGIFIEVFKDTTTEMAPLSHDDAMRAIHRIKAVSVLQGARGRKPADIEALATLLVRLGDFAVANAGRFRALDLNPIIVKPAGEGVVAVDIAVEYDGGDAMTASAAE